MKCSRAAAWIVAALIVSLAPSPTARAAPTPDLVAVAAAGSAVAAAPQAPPRSEGGAAGSRPVGGRPPGLTIEPYVRPDLARRLERLRPTILAAAQRHNRAELSGMSDEQFAAVIALVLYNENFGWLEDDVAPLRAFTPIYQGLQRTINDRMPGSDFSVWPANLRPSVALEILHRQLPLADSQVISVPVTVAGSRIDPAGYTSRGELYAAINREISSDGLAVAYLAANLERGLFRAAHEGAPVSWRTLAAWHNQGIVSPQAIRANPTARDYVRRASAYLPLAQGLVAPRPAAAAQVRAI